MAGLLVAGAASAYGQQVPPSAPAPSEQPACLGTLTSYLTTVHAPSGSLARFFSRETNRQYLDRLILGKDGDGAHEVDPDSTLLGNRFKAAKYFYLFGLDIGKIYEVTVLSSSRASQTLSLKYTGQDAGKMFRMDIKFERDQLDCYIDHVTDHRDPLPVTGAPLYSF